MTEGPPLDAAIGERLRASFAARGRWRRWAQSLRTSAPGGFTEEVSVVATDGTVTDAPKSKPHIGGGMIVDVPSREDVLEWAAKIAVACRCAQECHEILPDPAVGN
jgi:hypothetical protein